MANERPGHRALDALDQIIGEKPHREELQFSAATAALTAFRDVLIARQRDAGETPQSSARLGRLNAVISVVLGGHFPLGSVPWDEIEKARGWLAELVAEVEPPGYGAIFGPSANLWSTVVILALIGTISGGAGWWWFWPRTDYVRRVGFTVDQPVPFSHEHHVAGLGLDCRFCHTAVEVGSNAGMPPTYTCMTCHSQIWTNADLLAPVRESLAENKPIAWNVVNNLPDYVYFNHGIHIAKGVGCASCHGPVARMPLLYKAKSLTMAFCLDCHRDPAPQLRPADQITNTVWERTPDTPSPAALLTQYHVGGRNLTECSICHR